jgi:hypothetical protein
VTVETLLWLDVSMKKDLKKLLVSFYFWPLFIYIYHVMSFTSEKRCNNIIIINHNAARCVLSQYKRSCLYNHL